VGTTLIFPCSVPEAERYAKAAAQRGEEVVAASSLRYDVSAGKFRKWFFLPTVHDPEFPARLKEAIIEHDIARVFCPVLVADTVLKRLAAEGQLSVPVFTHAPIVDHLEEHRQLMEDAAAHRNFIQEVAEGKSTLSLLDVASAMKHSFAIFGQSGPDKVAAMMAIFAEAPRGDVVEVGVLAGRTAYILTSMARHHLTGPVLLVDAWSTGAAAQHNSASDFQEMIQKWSHVVPLEAFFESFILSLLPLSGREDFNYLALPSKEAHVIWRRDRCVRTPHFGEVHYTGAISVLHIDANHDLSQVQEDCGLWLPYLVPGGWLILDDYIWFHGDGPRQVGDRLLADEWHRIQRAFVCDKALFVKFGG
jgi:hypothetical protein